MKNLTSDLATVREQAAELALKAQNAERQISDTYDFNGTHRQTKGAEHMTSAGKETAVFKAMVDLQQGMRWAELLADCDIQIRETPTWLTPYLFSGIAYANLGNLAAAVDRLQFVVEKAGGDPSYSQAASLLARMRADEQKQHPATHQP